MAINFDSALGIHQYALQARVQRAEILANNLANAEPVPEGRIGEYPVHCQN